MTASNGESSGLTADQSLVELVKPSIFDTDIIKQKKGIMIEIQEYIAEISYMKQNADKLEKERAEAKAKQEKDNNDVPEGFGKP